MRYFHCDWCKQLSEEHHKLNGDNLCRLCANKWMRGEDPRNEPLANPNPKGD